MNKVINPEMVLLARESRGMTQTELAKKIGVTQAAVSKAEKFDNKVSKTMLQQLATTLNYPENFFYKLDYRYPPATPLHRKKQSLSQRVKNKIEAEANVRRLHIETLLDSIELEDATLPIFPVDEYGTPSSAANALRQFLRLPRGPISNVTDVIEKLGVIVIPCEFQTDKLDGFTMTGNDISIVFINLNMPWCRIRHTMAHELGHLVLGHVQKPGIEAEADEFASAFLMPEEDIRRDFNGERIDIHLLAMLKPKWKSSMQSLLMKAKKLGYLTDNQNKYLWMGLSKAGYRKREPGHLDIAPEMPKLFKEIVKLHRTELEYTEEELFEMIATNKDSFRELYPFVQEGAVQRKKAKVVNLFD